MATSSYWCYRCSRFVSVSTRESVVCPNCNSGFVEELGHLPRLLHVDGRRRRFPAGPMYLVGRRGDRDQSAGLDRPISRLMRRNASFLPPFNPVIVLIRTSDGSGGDGRERRRFQLYYNDDGGSGLRPLPPRVADFLMRSGFDRLLERLSQIEINGIRQIENHPASKGAIESLPSVKIGNNHLKLDSHCAVCTEAFEFGSEASEMPCKHLYHFDCILPWLSIRNSCPVCRHELPEETDPNSENGRGLMTSNGDQNIWFTIWRLPGGGFVVGRREGEPEFPEEIGDNNNGGNPRTISMASTGGRERNCGIWSRLFSNIFPCFRVSLRSSVSPIDPRPYSDNRRSSRSRSAPRSRRTWSMEVNSGIISW